MCMLPALRELILTVPTPSVITWVFLMVMCNNLSPEIEFVRITFNISGSYAGIRDNAWPIIFTCFSRAAFLQRVDVDVTFDAGTTREEWPKEVKAHIAVAAQNAQCKLISNASSICGLLTLVRHRVPPFHEGVNSREFMIRPHSS